MWQALPARDLDLSIQFIYAHTLTSDICQTQPSSQDTRHSESLEISVRLRIADLAELPTMTLIKDPEDPQNTILTTNNRVFSDQKF